MPKRGESFVPQMVAKAMKAFSKTGKRKQIAQTSEPAPSQNVIVVDGDHEVSSTTISDKITHKHRPNFCVRTKIRRCRELTTVHC
ncbi:XRE family transcriptional regulator [Sesbania bispinosa]|nr:XRE family transcriptional regulator [Sesbania bispinosa]